MKKFPVYILKNKDLGLKGALIKAKELVRAFTDKEKEMFQDDEELSSSEGDLESPLEEAY